MGTPAIARADRSKRRRVVAALFAPLLASPRSGAAAGVARIGYLTFNRAPTRYLEDAFREGLRALGYEEGRSLQILVRDAEARAERLPVLAAELVAMKVDVIVAGGASQAIAAKRATASIPIVFAGVADQVSNGLVDSLSRPGGNVTGTSLLAPELVGKSLQLLHETVPSARRIAVLWQPGAFAERTEQDMLGEAHSAARAIGITLSEVPARTAGELATAYARMAEARVDAITVFSGGVLLNERKRVAELAARARLPAMYAWREFVDAGGLMSYGANLAELYRRAATYVDRVLKGSSPSELPVEQPTRLELVVNLGAARVLGLEVPPAVLLRADQVLR